MVTQQAMFIYVHNFKGFFYYCHSKVIKHPWHFNKFLSLFSPDWRWGTFEKLRFLAPKWNEMKQHVRRMVRRWKKLLNCIYVQCKISSSSFSTRFLSRVLRVLKNSFLRERNFSCLSRCMEGRKVFLMAHFDSTYSFLLLTRLLALSLNPLVVSCAQPYTLVIRLITESKIIAHRYEKSSAHNLFIFKINNYKAFQASDSDACIPDECVPN